MWLLKSKKGSQTCGHLHVAEVEAWRCLDTQAEPSAWAVASASVTVKDKRPKQDLCYVLMLWMGLVMAPLCAVLCTVAFVVALVRQSWDEVSLFVVGLAVSVPFSFVVVQWFREEIGRPRILDWMFRRSVLREGR